MSRVVFLPLCFACLLMVAVLAGCSPVDFTAADMVVQLTLPDGFRWADMPITVDNPAALVARVGPDTTDLLEHDWQSSTLGQLASEKVTLRIAVHRLGSKKDAANILAEHKYPDAQPVKLGQQAYRWLDRNAAETIFFRRDAYFAQLTIDPRPDLSVLELLAAELDKLLARRSFPFL